MTSPADFHRLEKRVRLTGRLVARTAVRVGSGGGSVTDAVDLPVLKDADGYPFIPGSSLKGVLRSSLEALVHGLGENAPMWACDPLSRDEACGVHEEGERDAHPVEEHCTLCRVFGSHLLASHVRISDALVPQDERTGFLPVEHRDGVAIDRDLRIAADKKKYDFEVVAPGTGFELEVFVENPSDWMLGLLMVGFDQIADGFTAVGGFTSRGLGRMEIAWTEATTVTPQQLLAGEPPESWFGSFDEHRERWRTALAEAAGLKGAA